MTAPVLDQPAGAPEDGRGWPVPADEGARLAALHGFHVLDQPPQQSLDAAARLAAYICGTPAAAINLIDSDRQWQAAAYGAERAEVSRRDAMCAHTVIGSDVVYTEDARTQERFAANPFVTGAQGSVRLYVSAPLVSSDGHSVGALCAVDETPRELSGEQLSLLADLSAQVVSLFELRRAGVALARIAGRDGLTGLANRRSVETAITAAIARAERGLGTPSVVVVDLDCFKEINDTYGHVVGDAVLHSTAQRLTRTSRAIDTVGRVGGDEFIVLLESTGGPGAVAAIGRLRESLDGGWAEVVGAESPVSASLGITTYRPGDSVASLIARADAEMYADKARRSIPVH